MKHFQTDVLSKNYPNDERHYWLFFEITFPARFAAQYLLSLAELSESTCFLQTILFPSLAYIYFFYFVFHFLWYMFSFLNIFYRLIILFCTIWHHIKTHSTRRAWRRVSGKVLISKYQPKDFFKKNKQNNSRHDSSISYPE